MMTFRQEKNSTGSATEAEVSESTVDMSVQGNWEIIPEGEMASEDPINTSKEAEDEVEEEDEIEATSPTCEVNNSGSTCNGFCRSNSTKGGGDANGDATNGNCEEGGTKVTVPSSLPVVTNKNMKPSSKNCFRLVVLGSSKVGKTSLVSRFLTNKFEDNYTPTIEDFHRKLYRIRGDVYQLDILDTSGNHPFPAMRRLSFLTGDLFVLVFSWDSRDSWQEVMRLREQILETKQSASASSTGSRKKRGMLRVPMVIAGNKCDREQRGVSFEEVQEFVSSLSCCGYVDTSAKKEYNVDKLFYELFVLANLPMEMSPALHKRVCPCQPAQDIGSGSRHRGLSIRRRLSEAYGMVAPNVRRPSIRTDLLILRAKTSLHLTGIDAFTDKKPRRDVSCVIQ